jgi:DNA-binding MarR family transcriptional regulator
VSRSRLLFWVGSSSWFWGLILSFDDVGRFTIAAGRAMERDGRRRFSSHGLTVSDVNPLLRLVRLGPLTPNELLSSSVLLTSAPVVSHSLNRLENAGLVRRRPSDEDGRSVIIEITDEGLRVEAELAAQVLEVQESFFSPLTADEQAVLAGLLKRCIVRHLGASPDDPALL